MSNPNGSNNTNKNENHFDVKTVKEVVRVAGCTFGLQKKEDSFFICNCSDGAFFPICKACIETCHKGEKHENPFENKGEYDCKCGDSMHKIKPDKEIKEQTKECLYSKFFMITNHPGFYIRQQQEINETYCGYCFKFCLSGQKENFIFQRADQVKPETTKCHCKHDQIKILNINNTMESIKKAYKAMNNFNLNFFIMVDEVKTKTVDYINLGIKKYIKDMKSKDLTDKLHPNLEFFREYKKYKIFTAITHLRNFLKNPNVTMSAEKFIELINQESENNKHAHEHHQRANSISRKDKDIFLDLKDIPTYRAKTIEILSVTPNITQKFEDSEFEIFLESKMQFADFIYLLLFHPLMIKYTLSEFNCSAILNFNLFQRYIYCHKFKNFYELNPLNDASNSSNQVEMEALKKVYSDLNDYANGLLKLFNFMISNKDNVKIKSIAKSFSILNRLIKNLIQKNLLSQIELDLYFDIVWKVLKLGNEAEIEQFSFIIIKSVFYCMLYKNDATLIAKLYETPPDKGYKSNWASNSNKFNDLLTKIFLKILKVKGRSNYRESSDNSNYVSKKKLLKFDFYVKRCLDILAGKSTVNLDSYYNLQLIPDKDHPKKFFSKEHKENLLHSSLCLILKQNNIFFEKVAVISRDILECNRKYFCYEYAGISANSHSHHHHHHKHNVSHDAFSEYFREIINSLNELKVLINPESSKDMEVVKQLAGQSLKSIPSLLKPFTQSDDDLGDIENKDKILRIREAIKYSNFMQAIAGFISIYSENKMHTNYKLSESESEYMTFLLCFFYLIIKGDTENMNILALLDTKCFINTFQDCDEYFTCFMINLFEATFGNIEREYKYDNYTFLKKLLRQFLQMSDVIGMFNELIHSKNQNRIKEFEHCYKDFYCKGNNFSNLNNFILVLNLVKKSLRHVTIEENSFLDLVELINLKISEIKNHSDFMKLFLNEKIDDEYILMKLEKPSIRKFDEFICAYFSYINEILSLDISFYRIIKEEGYLIPVDSVDDFLEKKRDIPSSCVNSLVCELVMSEFYFLNKYYMNFYYDDSRVTKIYKYSTQIETPVKYFDRENFNLFNLIVKKNESSSEVKYETEKRNFLNELNESSEYLIQKMKRLDGDILKAADKIPSLVKRRLALLSYYENVIVRPVFCLVNQYLFCPRDLHGENVHSIYSLVKHFIESIKQFSEYITKTDIVRDSLDDISLFKKLDLYKNELLFLKLEELNTEELVTALDEVNHKTKYFELVKVLNVLNKHLGQIINNNDIDQKSVKNPTDEINKNHINQKFVKNPIEVKTNNDIDKKSVINPIEEIEKMDDHDRCFFKVVKLTDSDETSDFGENLFLYMMSKFNDKTQFYIEGNEAIEFDHFHYKKLKSNFIKIQNFYILNIFNNLFSLDYETYQEIIEHHIKDEQNHQFFNNLIQSLAIYNIYASTVYESRKFYMIKRRTANISITLNLALITIKFIQNLCEGHNRLYQKLLFEEVKILKIEDLDENDKKNFYLNNEDEIKTYLKNEASNKLVNFTSQQTKYAGDNEDFELFRQRKGSNLESFEKEETKNAISALKSQATLIKSSLLRSTYSYDSAAHKRNSSYQENYIIEPNIKEENENGLVTHKNISNLKGLEYLLYSSKESKGQKGPKDDYPKVILDNYSFLNFVFINMKYCLYHSHFNDDFTNKFNKDLIETEGLKKLNSALSDLIVEMIQGTNDSNFVYFYQKLGDVDYQSPYTNDVVEYFSLMKYMLEIKKLFNEEKVKSVEKETLDFKIKFFKIINTIISQQKPYDKRLYQIIIKTFPLEELVNISIFYIKHVYVNYVEEIKIDFDSFIFDKNIYENLEKKYQYNDIYKDDIFKLPAEIFLLITILSEKFGDIQAKRILMYSDSLDEKEKEGDEKKEKETQAANVPKTIKINDDQEGIEMMEQPLLNDEARHNSKEDKVISDVQENKNKINDINKKYVVKLFKYLIRQCEFVIRSSDDTIFPKIVYFLVDPRSFRISDSNLQYFFDNVDRSSTTSKLKALIKETDLFVMEVDYKIKNIDHNDNWTREWMEFNYEKVDIFNFIMACVINLILLALLYDENFVDTWTYYLIVVLSIIQIAVNVYFLYMFFKTKYDYSLLLEKERLNARNKNQLTWKEYINLYFFRTILNREIDLCYFNIIILIICLCSRYAIFMYPLMLFSVVKFVPTIRAVVKAFQLSFLQIMEMIGFLAILIYFYANVGFFFMSSEFVTTLDNGEQANLCATLLECYVTYFNLGIRSGGGIGDVLGMKAYQDSYWFWIRWLTDMVFFITVILLIMNMINGIIISTFGSIREDDEAKNEDQNNICFICDHNVIEFEEKKIDFKEHKQKKHNFKDYIRYFASLKATDEKELDADQTYIKNCIKNNDIAFFPVVKTNCLPDLENDDREDEEETEDNKQITI